jgi:hypothetical protein
MHHLVRVALDHTDVERHRVRFVAIAIAMLMVSSGLRAQSNDTPSAPTTERATTAPETSTSESWVQRWMRTVDEARASQPHFVAPIVTTHVMLVEQYRYDIARQRDAAGPVMANFGVSKGLELIPTTRLEIGIAPPPYLAHASEVPDGFGDVAFQVKYRAWSAPEGRGDYFVGVFLAGSLPTGSSPNGAGHAMLVPTLAGAKGLGPVDIQSTIATGLPVSGADVLGRTLVFNMAVDYRITRNIWPMLEVNSTSWSGGSLDGKHEVFLTPGLVVGGLPLEERLHCGFGVGVQIAVTEFRRYDHRWIVSARFPF